MSSPERLLIAYLRVSSIQQGKSGLGIEAQREALERFAAAEGYAIAREFVEVETGKGADALERRPQLAAALADARKRRWGLWSSPNWIGLAVTCISFRG